MNSTRRSFLQTGAALPLAAQASPRPNIVFIITDDLRFDALGCTGHPFARTPNVDRIAREGALFERFFTVTPLCSPSRASFLTGQYPHAHRIINNDKTGLGEISHTLITFPRILRDSGYETAFIGKWHMGFDDSRRPGWDHWISFHAQGLYVNPVINVNGTEQQLSGYTTDFLNNSAVDFIRRKRDKPFVLYLAHKAVHYPYIPAGRHDRLYADVPVATVTPPPGDVASKPIMTYKPAPPDVLNMEGSVPEPPEPRRDRPSAPADIIRDQARCLASVDEGVGQIFEALTQTGQLDNTLIVFTSDNGYLLGEHGQFDQKRYAYEEAVHLPLLMRYPKLIKPGSRPRQFALNIDIAPTMLELAGAKPLGPIHGRSLLPVLSDPAAAFRSAFLAEYFLEKYNPNVPNWQCVRTDRWKLIHYTTVDRMDELYDLEQDPREIRNLIDDPKAQQTINVLKDQMQTFLAKTVVPL